MIGQIPPAAHRRARAAAKIVIGMLFAGAVISATPAVVTASVAGGGVTVTVTVTQYRTTAMGSATELDPTRWMWLQRGSVAA